MASDDSENSRPGFVKPLGGIGGRAAASALRPVTGTMRVAAGLGISAERRLVDWVLSSDELERIPGGVLNDEHVRAALRRAVESDGAKRVVRAFFDSGLFEQFLERLGESEGLWRLVDEIAQSPSVLAALSQQSLGFAGQVGGAVRERSRKADHRVERTAGRVTGHAHDQDQADPDARGP
jgi:hypothetical protein